ncbi:MAG: hypothetical protein WDW38_006615 [Sanguina aurantia]
MDLGQFGNDTPQRQMTQWVMASLATLFGAWLFFKVALSSESVLQPVVRLACIVAALVLLGEASWSVAVAVTLVHSFYGGASDDLGACLSTINSEALAIHRHMHFINLKAGITPSERTLVSHGIARIRVCHERVFEALSNKRRAATAVVGTAAVLAGFFTLMSLKDLADVQVQGEGKTAPKLITGRWG